jgi:molybdate transport system substrate-binding protein
VSAVFFCAGAAKTAVEALLHDWPGVAPETHYDTVGALRDRVLAGERPDAIVLSDAALAALAEAGLITREAIRRFGTTGIGLAIRDGVTLPAIADEAGLRAALTEAATLGWADPERGATAGKHCVRVLAALGLTEVMRAKGRVYPFGVDAVTACGRGEVDLAVSQASEITGRPGVSLLGLLPPPHDLTTGYGIAPLAGSTAGPAIVAALTTPAAKRALAAIGFAG